jgi:hypothetical protein
MNSAAASVSGQGLPQNWIDLLSHGGYNI